MWKANDVLDVVAGPVDRPAQWRLQFWIWMAFGRASIVEIEEKGVYLWILSPEQQNVLGVKPEVGNITGHLFLLEEARELSVEKSHYWRNWPFFRVGDVVEEVEYQMRDGIWMTMRSFDGIAVHDADLTNPFLEEQPMRWQARKEVFLLLDELFNWNNLLYPINWTGRERRPLYE